MIDTQLLHCLGGVVQLPPTVDIVENNSTIRIVTAQVSVPFLQINVLLLWLVLFCQFYRLPFNFNVDQQPEISEINIIIAVLQ